MKGRLEKHETRKLWKTQGGRGREKVFYSGFNTCPSRGLKANTLRTAALSQNGGYIYIYIYLSGPADTGQTWIHLNSRVVIQTSAGGFIFKQRAAFSKFPQRWWKRSVCRVPAAHSETNSALFAPAFGTAFNRDARSPNRGKEGGRNEIFRTTFWRTATIHGRHNRRLFNSNELFFQPRDYHGHA